jgi:hypothetical protein
MCVELEGIVWSFGSVQYLKLFATFGKEKYVVGMNLPGINNSSDSSAEERQAHHGMILQAESWR